MEWSRLAKFEVQFVELEYDYESSVSLKFEKLRNYQLFREDSAPRDQLISYLLPPISAQRLVSLQQSLPPPLTQTNSSNSYTSTATDFCRLWSSYSKCNVSRAEDRPGRQPDVTIKQKCMWQNTPPLCVLYATHPRMEQVQAIKPHCNVSVPFIFIQQYNAIRDACCLESYIIKKNEVRSAFQRIK